MARIRTIKPDFFSDGGLGAVSPTARLLFIGTWVYADDHGNIERSSRQLKAQVFPYDALEVEPLVSELLKAGCLIEYERGGKFYLHIKGFEIHQRIDKKSNPRFPLFDGRANARGGRREPEPSLPLDLATEGKGREGKVVEGKGKGKPAQGSSPPAPPTPVAETWKSYAEAVAKRWKVEPTRNGRVNGQLANFVARVGKDAAPSLAAFYVRSDNPWYVKVKHSIDFLLRDAERLLMEMKIVATTGDPNTSHLMVTEADTMAETAEGKTFNLKMYPIEDPAKIAAKVLVEYRGLLWNKRARNIVVVTGARTNRFSIAELGGTVNG